MRLLLLTLALTAALAVPASAAPLGELAPLTLTGNPECLTATGTPGELATRTGKGVRFFNATREALQLGPLVEFGGSFCPSVATRASGAGVIAGEAGAGVSVRVRDPGGTWGEAIEIATAEDGWHPQDIIAAVSDRGDAIVAFKEVRLTDKSATARLRVARRAPGASFTAAEQIGQPSDRIAGIVPAIAATGEAFVLTSTIERIEPPLRMPVSVAIAPPGGQFGAPVRIGETRLLSTPSLQVSPDGRALVATVEGNSVLVAERAPGAAFAPATTVGTVTDQFAFMEAKLRADGAAAVAWREAPSGRATFVTRPAPGPFSAPLVAIRSQSLLPDGYDPFYLSETFFTSFFSGLSGVLLSGFGDIGLLGLTPDGRAALVATDTRRPQLVTAPLAGGPATIATGRATGSVDTDGILLPLADGTPAVVWIDILREDGLGNASRFQVRLAGEGIITPADPPAPRVRIGKPLSRDVSDKPLRLPVTCSAACEVRASGETTGSGELRLSKAGRGVLRVSPVLADANGRLRLRVSTSAPGALYARERTITVRVTPGAPVDEPQVSDVRARRSGDRIVVTFRLSEGDFGLPVYVSGEDTRGWNGEPLVTRTVQMRGDKRTYRVKLPARDGLRYVVVRVPTNYEPGARIVVRVR